MEPVLRDTYGTIVYQEQVMRLAQVLGGLSLNDADGLRKAMGKKDKERMASYEEKFLTGCAAQAIAAPVAAKIWSDMSRFAEYGFNKSHSAAYGLICAPSTKARVRRMKGKRAVTPKPSSKSALSPLKRTWKAQKTRTR